MVVESNGGMNYQYMAYVTHQFVHERGAVAKWLRCSSADLKIIGLSPYYGMGELSIFPVTVCSTPLQVTLC
jgi:hypothetical protein